VKRFSIQHLWVFVVLACSFAYVSTLPLEPNDYWVYLKNGAITMSSKHIVRQDHLSFTAAGKQYINLQWLSEIIFYGLYRLGGVPLSIFCHALLTTASFALILILARKNCGNLRIAAGVTFICLTLSATNLALRPQAFSVFFFPLALLLLQYHRFLFLPLVVALWANCHGAFVLGPLLVGIEWLGALPKSPFPSERLTASGEEWPTGDGKSHRAVLLVAFLLSVIASFLNPAGPGIYRWVSVVERNSRANLLMEWDPPTLMEPTGFLFFLSLLALVIIHNKTRLQWKSPQVLKLLVFTLMALRQQRAVIWWAMAVVPFFAREFDQLSQQRSSQQRQAMGNTWIVNWGFALILSVFLLSTTPWLKSRNLLLPPLKRALLSPDTPVCIAKSLQRIRSPLRIFNNLGWGGYLAWKLDEGKKVYCHSLVYVFPEVVMGDYLLISNGYAEWERLLQRYRVNCLVLSKAEQRLLIPLVLASRRWQVYYQDELGIVFISADQRGR